VEVGEAFDQHIFQRLHVRYHQGGHSREKDSANIEINEINKLNKNKIAKKEKNKQTKKQTNKQTKHLFRITSTDQSHLRM
jgi:hypothetical protein